MEAQTPSFWICRCKFIVFYFLLLSNYSVNPSPLTLEVKDNQVPVTVQPGHVPLPVLSPVQRGYVPSPVQHGPVHPTLQPSPIAVNTISASVPLQHDAVPIGVTTLLNNVIPANVSKLKTGGVDGLLSDVRANIGLADITNSLGSITASTVSTTVATTSSATDSTTNYFTISTSTHTSVVTPEPTTAVTYTTSTTSLSSTTAAVNSTTAAVNSTTAAVNSTTAAVNSTTAAVNSTTAAVNSTTAGVTSVVTSTTIEVTSTTSNSSQTTSSANSTTTNAATTETSATTTAETTSVTATTATTSTSTSAATTESPHALPGWAIAIITLALIVILLAAVGILFIRYRRSRIPMARPVSTIFKKQLSVTSTPQSIAVENFSSVYQEKLAQERIQEEFERIQEHSARLNAAKSREVGQSERNRNRNRFVDIIPFDDNYVQLDSEQGNPPSKYINASYVENIFGVRKVIATQGPKQNTVVEFWRMVLEKKSRHIVNLTNCMEGGRVKCHQYWPPNGQMLHFDDISLFTQEEKEIYPGLFRRKIEVQLGELPESDSTIVEQLHLTTWPDHGVPNSTSTLIAFMSVAQRFGDKEYTVIHCSAGVGRTGTFIALKSILEQIKREGCVDIFKTVMELRSRRPKLVQTQEQYSLLYQVANLYVKQQDGQMESTFEPADDVLDAGIVNFGFEYVK